MYALPGIDGTSFDVFPTQNLLDALKMSFWFISSKGNSCTEVEKLPRRFRSLRWKEIYDFEYNIHYIHWKGVIIRERITHYPSKSGTAILVEFPAQPEEEKMAFFESMVDEMRESW